MDTPEDAGRYLGCEHVFKQNVKLDVNAHPFAHVFDASIPDPSSKPASPARRTKDYWEHMPELGVVFIITCNLVRSSRTSRRTMYPSGRERTG